MSRPVAALFSAITRVMVLGNRRCTAKRFALPYRLIHNASGHCTVAYELTGKIKLLQDPRTFDSGFTKREMVVIVDDGKYPQEINLEFVQDRVGLLDDLQPGQTVTVSFDIRGREYNGRYFNNLQGWKIVTGEESSAQASSPPQDVPPADAYDDDIPF
jgi:hypothetical protein